MRNFLKTLVISGIVVLGTINLCFAQSFDEQLKEFRGYYIIPETVIIDQDVPGHTIYTIPFYIKLSLDEKRALAKGGIQNAAYTYFVFIRSF